MRYAGFFDNRIQKYVDKGIKSSSDLNTIQHFKLLSDLHADKILDDRMSISTDKANKLIESAISYYNFNKSGR